MALTIRTLSPMERAMQLQEQAAERSLDWTRAEDLWSRINDCLAEIKAAGEDLSTLKARIAVRENFFSKNDYYKEIDDKPEGMDAAHRLLREELGELLFAVVDVCRILNVDPRAALEIANRDFENCVNYVEQKLCKEGVLMGLESPERLQELWSEARRKHGIPENRTTKIDQGTRKELRASYGTA